MGKRGSFIHRAVFGRGGRSCGQRAVGLAPQEVFAEKGTTAHQGVGCLAQELLVAGEVVIIPKVGGEPGRCHGVIVPRHVGSFQRCGETEDIGRNAGGPSACSPISLGGAFARLLEQADEIGQRLGTLGEVGGQGRPVVHLQVDVVVVIDAPRAVHVVVPHTLQIGGHISRARRSDEQVTAKLIVEGFQRAVGFSLAIVGQTLVGGLAGRCSGQLKLHTVEEGHIVLEVRLEELVVALPCGPGYPFFRGFIGFYAHIGFRVGEIGVVVGGIIGVGGEQEYDLVGTVDAELAVFIGTGTSLGHDAEAHHVA